MTKQQARLDVDEETVRAWLCAAVARTAGVATNSIDSTATFAYFGLNSLQYVDLTVQLESWLGREIPPTAAYDFPSIELLARYVVHALPDAAPAGISPEAWT
ncbi:MAG TPA: acyl carrier protein [Vicinamibacterales bacterium]|nr:acyl carrier protein [Vicinamibacterales bacterium]